MAEDKITIEIDETGNVTTEVDHAVVGVRCEELSKMFGNAIS